MKLKVSLQRSHQLRHQSLLRTDQILQPLNAPSRHTHLTFRHRSSCILGQAFRYSPENAFYVFNQEIYFIM